MVRLVVKTQLICSWPSISQFLKINKGISAPYGELSSLRAVQDLKQCVQSKHSYNIQTTNCTPPGMSIWADWLIPLILNLLCVTLPISPSCFSKPRCCCTDWLMDHNQPLRSTQQHPCQSLLSPQGSVWSHSSHCTDYSCPWRSAGIGWCDD